MISKHLSFFFCLLFLTNTLFPGDLPWDNAPQELPQADLPEERAAHNNSSSAAVSKIQIHKISESQIGSQVQSMKKFLFQREVGKNLIYGAGILAGFLLLKLASNHQINEEYAVQARQYQNARAAAVANAANPNGGVGSGFWNWVKSVPGTTGSLFQATVPAFLANVIISKGWSTLQDSIAAPIQDASIEWYLKGYTYLKDSLSIIKLNAAVLDTDSFYLNFKTNQVGQKIALQNFMQDVRQAVGHKDDFVRSYLPLKVANNYIRQSSYLDQLEDEALMIEGMKKGKQFAADGDNQSELLHKKFARNAVHVFAKKLKIDIEKLLAFMIARYENVTLKSEPIRWIIDLTNGYLSEIESLLNMSDKELAVASREKRGLFTKSFEFNKHLNDALKTLQSQLV